MKTTPFICNSFEVRGILTGSKIMARRIVKPQGAILTDEIARSLNIQPPKQQNMPVIKCPYGNIGDVLWVRETWFEADGKYYYKADNTKYRGKSSTQMPKTACRIWLEITNIKVEDCRILARMMQLQKGLIKRKGTF